MVSSKSRVVAVVVVAGSSSVVAVVVVDNEVFVTFTCTVDVSLKFTKNYTAEKYQMMIYLSL